MSKRPARKSSESEPSSKGSKGGGGRSRVGAMFRALLRFGWIIGAMLATVLFPFGLALRLTVRDDVDALAIVFYITPWSVLAIGGFVAAWYWRAWRRCAIVVALVALACACMWVWTGWRFAPQPASGAADFRVSYWNCARPGWRLRGVLPMAASWKADLLCFGESRPTGPLSPKWAEAFPGHTVQPLPREMMMIGAHEAEVKGSGSLGGAGEFQLLSTRLGGREVFILIVDFDALANRSRRPAFERLYQLVDAYATKPLIVMGDFNTPTDSVHFQRLRGRLSDAFETSGRGLAATWPTMAPVLALDHILVNKHLRVVKCEHHTSLYSDHRAVVADLAWK